MSFLIKHQIMHVIRQRQQKRIAEENLVYFAVLQKALPQEPKPPMDDSERESKNGTDDGASTASTSLSGTVQLDRDFQPKISPKTSQGSGGGGSNKVASRDRMGSSSGGRHGKSGGSRTQDRSNNSSKSQSHSTGEQHQPALHGTGTVTVQNGDVPRPSSAGKVHVVGGKKQLAVKAVPRTSNQTPHSPAVAAAPASSATTSGQTNSAAMDAVRDKVCVCGCVGGGWVGGCGCGCVCV